MIYIFSKKYVYVFLFLVNTSVMSQVHPIDPDLRAKQVSAGILPRTLKCGPIVTTCGHVMHAKCYQTMFDNLVKQQLGME